MEQKQIKSQELFEVLLPEYFDADALKVPPEITYRIDNKGERLYARKRGDEVKIVPSVTTVLRMMPTAEHLIEWHCKFPSYEDARAHVEQRAHYGTFMHMLFAQVLQRHAVVFAPELLADAYRDYLISIGKTPERYDLMMIARDLQQDLFAFVKWCKDHNVKPIGIEYIVFGDEYAGAADLICKMRLQYKKPVVYDMSDIEPGWVIESGHEWFDREVTVLVDFKSGRKGFYEEHIMQLHALRLLWDAEHPEHKIDFIANYGCKNYRLPLGASEPYDFKIHKDKDIKRAAEKWKHCLGMYRVEPIKVKDRVEYRPGTIGLDSDLSELVETTNVLKELLKRMEENDASENTERVESPEATGDRKSEDRPESAVKKRRGKADQSGLF